MESFKKWLIDNGRVGSFVLAVLGLVLSLAIIIREW